MPDEITINGELYVRASVDLKAERGREPEGPDDLLTVEEAARLAGRARRTLYDAIRAGELEAMTPNGISKGKRIRRKALVAWMEGGRAEG